MSSSLDLGPYIRIVGEAGLTTSRAVWRNPPGTAWHRPDLIVAPETTDDVARLVSQARADGIQVVTAGGGTSYGAGVATPHGGLLISTERLNAITQIDPVRGLVTVGAGTRVEALNQALAEAGLWWPHDPGSRAMATVGGAVSVNGMGTYYSRYGAAPDSVLGLTVVLPTGEIVALPVESPERAGTLRLKDIFIRTEGVYGTITEVRLKVWPVPATSQIEVYGFETITSCENCVRELLREPISPDVFFVESRVRFRDSLGNRATLPDSDRSQWFLVVGIKGAESLVSSITTHLRETATRHGGAVVNSPDLINAYWEKKTAISTLQRTTIPSYHIVDPSLPYLALTELNRLFVESTDLLPTGIERKGERYYFSWPAGHTTLSGQVYYDENDAYLVTAAADWVERFTQAAISMGSPQSAILGSGKRFGKTELPTDRGAREVIARIGRALTETK